jgi:hypothetical protein
MSFKNLFIKHERSKEEEVWLLEETAEQEERFQVLEKAMEDLKPQRVHWYQEFFDRITTTGFNVDGDEKVVIPLDQIPVQPEGKDDRVMWKYGIDKEQKEN